MIPQIKLKWLDRESYQKKMWLRFPRVVLASLQTWTVDEFISWDFPPSSTKKMHTKITYPTADFDKKKKLYFDDPIDQRVRYIVTHYYRAPPIIPSSLKAVRKMTKWKVNKRDVCEHMVISRKHTLLQANQSRNPNGWIFVLLSPIAYGDLI